jgi:hypothetical protein
MSSSLDSLKETASDMHPLQRVVFELTTLDQWYSLIREANQLYGPHKWRCQARVRRKLEHNWANNAIRIWFEVPDSNFASWVAVKHSVIARVPGNK